jgi:hypothetical protein
MKLGTLSSFEDGPVECLSQHADVYLPQNYPMSISWTSIPPGSSVDATTEENRDKIRQLAEMSDDQLRETVHTAAIIGWVIRVGVSSPAAITTRGVIENRYAIGDVPAVVVSYDKRGRGYFVKWLVKARDDAKQKIENHEN